MSQFENRVPLKPVLGGGGGGGGPGGGQCCNITLLLMNRLNKTESVIFVHLMVSLLPEDLHSELILHSKTFRIYSRALAGATANAGVQIECAPIVKRTMYIGPFENLLANIKKCSPAGPQR